MFGRIRERGERREYKIEPLVSIFVGPLNARRFLYPSSSSSSSSNQNDLALNNKYRIWCLEGSRNEKTGYGEPKKKPQKQKTHRRPYVMA